MFAFGMFTRLRIRDGWMPVVAVAAPVLSALVQYWAREAWDYRIGFELLIYNAVFTMAGMLLLAKKNEN
jgi:mannitol-specific phosphotransferase system IIBC component